AYDVRKVITAVVDDGEFFPMKPDWAKNIVTGLARVGGHPIGILANQPMVLGGALDVNSADKAARFVWLCDAFGIPLVFLMDVPGFIVGSAVEKQGIIRHGAKMLFAVSEATVPKITVGLRHAQVDDIIDPADTRAAIWRGLHIARTKTIDRPWRKHGVLPV